MINIRTANPSWSPDGKEIAFNSDRSGQFQVWMIRPDWSDLQQITDLRSSPNVGVWSPGSNRLAVRIPQQVASPARVVIVNMRKPEQIPETLPITAAPGAGSFSPNSWSPDGRMLALVLAGVDSIASGIYIYNFDSYGTEKLMEFGNLPQWLVFFPTRHLCVRR